MVLKLKKRCMAFFAILILIQFSDVLSIHKKNKMEKYDLRKLQTTTTTPYTTPNSTEPSPNPPYVKKSSKGLSAGGIVAIIIPCIAALIAVGALAALCRSTPPAVPPVGPNYMDTSLVRIKPPVQPIVQQPVAVVQQPVAVVQEVPVVQTPVAVVEQPVAAVVEQPVAAVVEQPVAVVQDVVQPVAVVNEPVA